MSATQEPKKKRHRNRNRNRKRGGGGGGTGQASDLPAVPVSDIPMVDTHCHIEYVQQKWKGASAGEVMQRARSYAPNLEAAVTVFCDPASLSPSFGTWMDTLEEEGVYACFGIHPHNAKYYDDIVEERIVTALQHPKAVAWGLDFHYNRSPRDVQLEVFQRQVLRAVELGKPVVVHSRDAAPETFEILSAFMPKEHRVHIHCFGDDGPAAQQLIDTFPNAFIGITAAVTFDSASSLRDVVRDVIPLERLLLETDAPYMCPKGRGKVSHPGHCLNVAAMIADLKQVGVDDVLAQIRVNTAAMYGI